MRVRLGINIDHVATLRQARRGIEPDPVRAAVLAELGGADGITIHLREDRRHILDRDVRLLAATLGLPMNLEMADAGDIVEVALEVRPHQATLVPERREEVTTEGGLDVAGQAAALARTVARLREAGIRVATFIEADPRQVRASADAGAVAVELHTGAYARAFERDPLGAPTAGELQRIRAAADAALQADLAVHAGHGLNYVNTPALVAIPEVEEVNIGHAVVSRALFTGLERAVRDMRELIDGVRPPRLSDLKAVKADGIVQTRPSARRKPAGARAGKAQGL